LTTPLENLSQLDFDGSSWTGGRLKDGGQFSANTFLLGDTRWIDRFDAGKTAALPPSPALTTRRTSSLAGQLSPLLAARVICGGERPLRLAIEQDGDQLHGLIESGGVSTEQQLRHQLEQVLPFARYELGEDGARGAQQPGPVAAQQPPQLTSLPLRIAANLYCADSSLLLPEMGAAGAALLGWTLAENLAKSGKPAKA